MSKPFHHIRQTECPSRAAYREGRKPKAVKVYTVNLESQYLIVQGVPAVGASQDLMKLFGSHGNIEEFRALDDYPAEQFTEVYLIKYGRIQAARVAKRRLDDWSFYGGVLHVCYAPEHETVQETREKLQDRRKVIAAKTRQYKRSGTYSSTGSQQSSSGSQQNLQSLPSSGTYSSTGSQQNLQSLPSSGTYSSTGSQQNLQSLPSSQVTSTEVSQHATTETRYVTSQVITNQNDSSDRTAEYNNSSGVKVFHADNHNQKSCYNHGNQDYPNCMQTGSLISSDENSNNFNPDPKPGTSSTETSETEQIWLPPPPKQLSTVAARQRPLHNYEFAKVPTAQAVFPVNYDARLDHKTEGSSGDVSDINLHQSEASKAIKSLNDNKEPIFKSIQEKIEESMKDKSGVVIKDFSKKGPTPKFIPRQANNKLKSIQKQKSGEISTPSDEANKQLRKDAFTLSKTQGPEQNRLEPVKGPDAEELSVNKTVREIRKRVSQISGNKEQLSKKRKATEHCHGNISQ